MSDEHPSDPPSGHMSPEEFRRQGHATIDWIADYWTRIGSLPVRSQVSPGEIRAALPATRLWQRRPSAEDFLMLYAGAGNVPSNTEVQDAINGALPSWYEPLSTVLTVISLLAILGAVILLAIVNLFRRGRVR